MARIAKSLDVLRTQINALAPKRNKASDGWLGDPAHASRASRHNPNNAGVVCAIDITHDPKNGCDIHAIARHIAKNPHPDLEYIISNAQVSKRSNNWQWTKYTGANPHDKHVHFAVGRGPDSEPTQPYDTTTKWSLPGASNPSIPKPGEEEDMKPRLIQGDGSGEWWKFDGIVLWHVPTRGHAEYQVSLGMLDKSEPSIVPQAFVNELPKYIANVPTVAVTEAQVNAIAEALKKDLKVSTQLSDADISKVASAAAKKTIEEIAS